LLIKGSQTFSWDSLGRMTGLTNGGTKASYDYNGDGMRVGRTVNGTATTYLQDLAAGLPVVMVESTNSIPTRYIYGTDLMTQLDNADAPAYYHADGLGSTRAMSDLSGQQTATYTYDAFGAVRTQTGGAGNPFTFTGEQADPEAGLVFLRARYYDPEVGRFINKDAFGGFDRRSQTRNLYVYVTNNPTNMFDPTGLFSWNEMVDWGKTTITTILDATKELADKMNRPLIESVGELWGAISLSQDINEVEQKRLEMDRKFVPVGQPGRQEYLKARKDYVEADLALNFKAGLHIATFRLPFGKLAFESTRKVLVRDWWNQTVAIVDRLKYGSEQEAWQRYSEIDQWRRILEHNNIQMGRHMDADGVWRLPSGQVLGATTDGSSMGRLPSGGK
jgi:RHS repeat-associated protein